MIRNQPNNHIPTLKSRGNTDDKFKYVKYGKSVYYKPRDFLMFADDEYVFERLDEIEHFDLFGYPTITTIKRE